MRKLLVPLLFGLFLTGCEQQTSFQGYIEGQFRYISSSNPGVLEQLFVDRGTQVANGQSLFVLEQQPESDQLNQAKAQFAQAQAQKAQADAALVLAKLTLTRNQELLRKKVLQQSAVDEAVSNYQQVQAQIAQAVGAMNAAQAAIAQAQWSKAQKTIFAPTNAEVFDTYFLPGELVPAGQPVLSLLAPQDINVIFFIPEPELSTVHLGQHIKISCDSCSSGLGATINFISPQAEYTPPLIYSESTRSKLVYHIEAAPDANSVKQLHPGQPVTVVLKN